LAQLASILNWKKYYGPIKLFCNKQFLDSISKYGLDKEYDSIDTEFIETTPYLESKHIFWSFSKIHIAHEVAKYESEFCILDTDIWIQSPGLIDTGCDISFYHREAFDINYKLNPYPDPSNWLSDDELKQFDWNVYPMNCAIIYFKNRSKEVIDAWYKMALQVVTDNQSNESEENLRGGTIFIEQRLLPTIASKLNLTIGSISPNIYLTWISSEYSDGREWRPVLGFNDYSTTVVENVKHVWGAKSHYDLDWIRTLIIGAAILGLHDFNVASKFEQLYTECIDVYPEKDSLYKFG